MFLSNYWWVVWTRASKILTQAGAGFAPFQGETVTSDLVYKEKNEDPLPLAIEKTVEAVKSQLPLVMEIQGQGDYRDFLIPKGPFERY